MKYKPKPLVIDYEKYNYVYQFTSNPTLYLRSFFKINNLLSENNKGKFHTIPLYTSAIPSYITLTTSALLKLFTKNTLNEGQNKTDGDDENKNENINQNYNIWRKYFRIFEDDNINSKSGTVLRKEFIKKGYHFHYICTDGVGVTILFRNDNFMNKNYKPNISNKCKVGKLKNLESDVPYLSDINSSKYINHNIVAIDPNKIDVLYCTDGNLVKNIANGKEKIKTNTFRYTKPQIDYESKKKRYEEIKNIARKKSGMQNIESLLSETNPKSTNYIIFDDYLRAKIRTFSNDLLSHYGYDKKPYEPVSEDKASYRKMKLNAKINSERSEANMLNNFEKKFGKKDKTTVCFGNYSQNHLKGTDPVKGKGFRKLFKDRGYKIFLIDEFRTSKICHSCHNELKLFHKKGDRKKKKNDYKVRNYEGTYGYIRGVLQCQHCYNIRDSDNRKCFSSLLSKEIENHIQVKEWIDGKMYKVWNRDLNASLNILMKAKYEIQKFYFKDIKLPKIFCREKLDV